MSSFAGLNNARRALAAQLKSMEVAGQNIANANTPGYSRQVANHAAVILDSGIAVRPEHDVLSLAGVEVAEIRRQYDGFLDARLRQLTSNHNETVARHDVLTRMEELLHEPGDATIGTAMESLWTSFAQLATNPANDAARNDVLYRANTVVESFHDVANEAFALRSEAGERAAREVERINAIVQSLAGVNERLVSTAASGAGMATPNALLDKRDALLRELSQFSNVDVTEQANGAIRVTIGGRTLLDGTLTVQVNLMRTADDSYAVMVANQRIPDDAIGGMLGGELITHNQDVSRYIQQLDELAQNLINQVNLVHAGGYDPSGATGAAFFAGTSARDIALSADILGKPNKLAMSEAADGSDGRIAQKMADLREAPSIGELSITFQYGSLVSGLGSEVSSLAVKRDNNQALVEFAEARAESISGVSLDEELTDMVRFQQAYSAAARVLTSIDEALDILINRTGHVGR